MQAEADAICFIGEDQFGFRKRKGTRDAIGALRVIGERSLQHGESVYICFVDYEKAFDGVDWQKLTRVLKCIGIDYRD